MSSNLLALLSPVDEPDLRLIGLTLWVHGDQSPHADDYWDGNWLNVTAQGEAHGAAVQASGAFLRTDELREFRARMLDLYGGRLTSVSLQPMEPELQLSLELDTLGAMQVKVELTPDPLTQRHEFLFQADQSFLPGLIRQCQVILDRLPVRGAP